MFKVTPRNQRPLADEGFVARLEELLAENFYGRVPTPEERARVPFRGMIEHGMEVARSYGLKTERDLAGFVLNMVRINPEFHLQPKINAILRDGALKPAERRDKLLSGVSDDEWEEAARMTDDDAYWDRVLPEDDGGSPPRAASQGGSGVR
jgi:hypothetical protein